MKCIIVDDDKLTRKTLSKYIEKRPELKLIGEFADAASALKSIRKDNVDLVFLDMVMPDITGLDVLKSIDQLPQIIIISDHKEYAVEGFNYNVTDYLTKPVPQDRFSEAIDKVFQRQVFEKVKQGKYYSIAVKQRSGYINVSTDDILYVEGFGDYVNVFLTEGKKVTVLSTIKGMEEQLIQYDFMRIHRSYIANLKKVEKIVENDVHLGEKTIPVSRTYRSTLIKLFKTGAVKS
ncbi:MAG: LytTR family DNA-binding domain-containing protein [Crocinitomicaceae bacterium]|nr:LytTR family DNA-binding domain-containing protein [Crocinitomicaceae bacterium]